MTDWPEAVRAHRESAARGNFVDRSFPDCGRTIDMVEESYADAAIAALKEMVEVERNLTTSAHRAENAKQKALDEQRHRAEKAEAEVERLRWMLDSCAIDLIEERSEVGRRSTYKHVMDDLAARYDAEHDARR